jgi:hypothetical protein
LSIKGALGLLAGPKAEPEPLDTRTLRQRQHEAAMLHIRECAAIGRLFRWADNHGKKESSRLQWLFDLKDAEFDDLLEWLSADGSLGRLEDMVGRSSAHYGLSFSLWPEVWILAITRESRGDCDALNQYARKIQENLNAAGLDHATAAASGAKADRWLASVATLAGCSLDEPNDQFIQVAMTQIGAA